MTEKTEKLGRRPHSFACFYASLPPTASAIRVHGESGMRVILDIPDTFVAEALRLVGWRSKLLKVTIEVSKE